MDSGAANRKGFIRVGFAGESTVIRAWGIEKEAFSVPVKITEATRLRRVAPWNKTRPLGAGFLFVCEVVCIIQRWMKSVI